MLTETPLTYNHLKRTLQDTVKNITLEDIYNLSYQFQEDMKYLPEKYKKDYRESIIKVSIKRYKQLKNDKKDYPSNITEDDIKKINELLDKNIQDNNMHLLNILAIYATYFLKEPIHKDAYIFAGIRSIYYDGTYYYCPIKKYHINNENSLCKYCIARIDEGDENDRYG